jgi:FdhD protein
MTGVTDAAGAAWDWLDDRLFEVDLPRRPGSKTPVQVLTVEGGRTRWRSDQLATEEPLEMRLVAGEQRFTVAITMRTPGNDFELAAGFLFGEGVLGDQRGIRRITYCVDPGVDAQQRYNIVNVELRTAALPDVRHLERHFTTTSACGVCGKTSLEALTTRGYPLPRGRLSLTPELLRSLPERLREAQGLFQSTGGLHAAALFDAAGQLVAVREDIGRHNAVDKLIGWALLEGRLPLDEHIVLLSGRASYELLQKSVAAGVPVVCAVSAPSSLAVAIARQFDQTLVGFLRGDRCNIYSGQQRLRSGA